ncbi:MAG: thiamine phosphate synthase [Gemmatimonadota bacterium]|nr:thiamine phosphate synthase [Gemmatimonadota bacterium]
MSGEAGEVGGRGVSGAARECTGRLPRLHVIAGDEVIGAEACRQRLRPVLGAGGGGLALHLRVRRTPVARLFEVAERLAEEARATGTLVIVNDRVDVALAAGAGGVHLREDSLPPGAVRAIAGPGLRVGRSIHGAGQAVALRDEGLDYLFMGAAYATASHPERTPAGPDAVSTAAAQAAVPVLAIGGVTPARVRELAALGVYGVAVLSGVWGRERPDRAVARYLQVLEEEGLQ